MLWKWPPDLKIRVRGENPIIALAGMWWVVDWANERKAPAPLRARAYDSAHTSERRRCAARAAARRCVWCVWCARASSQAPVPEPHR